MTDTRLFSKISRGLSERSGAGLQTTLNKGIALLREAAAARIHLRSCDRVGPGARAVGRPVVDNGGRIEIGGGFVVRSTYAPAELVTGADGSIDIGDEVWLNFGVAINAQDHVEIGDRTHIGQYSILADTEVPEANGGYGEKPRPIRVGEDVWIAGRVTVLPGASIGDGSVITAGSVVDGEIPAGVVAGGIPARVLRRIDSPDAIDAAETATDAEPAPPRGAAPAQPQGRLVATTTAIAPAMEPAFNGILIADFTATDLQRHIERDGEAPILAVEEAPFGQVVQSLLGTTTADFALVWTRPETTIGSFGRMLEFEDVDPEEVLAEVDTFTAAIATAAARFRFVFVPTWTLPPWQRGLGALDAGVGGVTRTLWMMNLRLAENLAGIPNAHVLDAQRWIAAAGRGYSAKAWYLGKVAFHDEVLIETTLDLKAALRGLTGQARKLLLFDLDDTLWGGIVGDDGWENLRLGGHDSEGEAFADLQRAAKALRRRGVLIGIVSKNEEATALEAIRRHPAMVLGEDDFVGWRINWSDKARNISELAAELNLGLQSVVFIDDNPVERARVRDALPEVLVPEWPEDKLLGPSALLGLRCFDTPALTAEDAQRAEQYASERRRGALRTEVGSIDDWLIGLGIRVHAEPLRAANLPRAAQLLNKTNQMNLSTRRMAEHELAAWAEGTARALWTITVSDRFGDAGLTGIVSLEAGEGVGRIVDFVLSCRVMGRKVEQTMLHIAVSEAIRLGLSSVEARYLPTAKNAPCLSFFRDCGFDEVGETFVWDTSTEFPLPQPITLEHAG